MKKNEIEKDLALRVYGALYAAEKTTAILKELVDRLDDDLLIDSDDDFSDLSYGGQYSEITSYYSKYKAWRDSEI